MNIPIINRMNSGKAETMLHEFVEACTHLVALDEMRSRYNKIYHNYHSDGESISLKAPFPCVQALLKTNVDLMNKCQQILDENENILVENRKCSTENEELLTKNKELSNKNKTLIDKYTTYVVKAQTINRNIRYCIDLVAENERLKIELSEHKKVTGNYDNKDDKEIYDSIKRLKESYFDINVKNGILNRELEIKNTAIAKNIEEFSALQKNFDILKQDYDNTVMFYSNKIKSLSQTEFEHLFVHDKFEVFPNLLDDDYDSIRDSIKEITNDSVRDDIKDAGIESDHQVRECCGKDLEGILSLDNNQTCKNIPAEKSSFISNQLCDLLELIIDFEDVTTIE